MRKNKNKKTLKSKFQFLRNINKLHEPSANLINKRGESTNISNTNCQVKNNHWNKGILKMYETIM